MTTNMPQTMEELSEYVKYHDGVVTVGMARVRDCYGKERLGKYVREGISKELASHGICHYPANLPYNQFEQVRLVQMGTPVHDVIEASSKIGVPFDSKLRAIVSLDKEKVIQKIRELVGV